MRRVVMGSDAEGQSVVLADEKTEPTTVAVLPGFEVYRVWELDDTATLPVTKPDGATSGGFFPGPRGVRFGFLTVPPHTSYIPPEGTDMAAAAAEAEAKLPGMAATFDPERPGMHTTSTVDYIVVVSGQARMHTDNDVEVILNAGDCLIQNGTAHAWFNDTDEPLVLAYTLCGARIGGER